ncbi:MAG: amino acid ABC transporter substrate-binding protein [Pseudonocardiaceae bacterium]|nr:MAG: amino acid ABC transporter substrate-binding protein [Pseudonocardiaceae bacterium]
MTRWRNRLGVAVVAATALVLTACGGGGSSSGTGGSGADKQTLEFAVVAEITGKYAPYGLQLQAGVNEAVKDLNASGNYPFTIQPKFYDCQSEQAICVSKTRDAVTSDKMPLVMGPVVSLDILPAAEVTQRANTPHAVFAVLPDITDKYTNTFRWSAQNDVNNKTVVDFVKAKLQPGEGVAIVHANTDFGNGGAKQQADGLAAAGITPVANIGHDPSQADYTPVMVELNAKKPKYILLSDSDPADVAKLLRQSRENGVTGQWVGADASGAIQLAGDDAKGYMIVSPWFPNNATDPNSVELSKRFVAAGIKDPGWIAAMAYDATKGVAESAKAKGLTAADITAGMESLTDMPGKAVKSWTFTKDNRRGLTTSTIGQWDGTGFTTAWPQG